MLGLRGITKIGGKGMGMRFADLMFLKRAWCWGAGVARLHHVIFHDHLQGTWSFPFGSIDLHSTMSVKHIRGSPYCAYPDRDILRVGQGVPGLGHGGIIRVRSEKNLGGGG